MTRIVGSNSDYFVDMNGQIVTVSDFPHINTIVITKDDECVEITAVNPIGDNIIFVEYKIQMVNEHTTYKHFKK